VKRRRWYRLAKKKPQAVDRNLTHQTQTDSDMEFVMENIEPDDELILNDLAEIDKAIQALSNLEDSITTQRPQQAAIKAVSDDGKASGHSPTRKDDDKNRDTKFNLERL
jgi:hypothetical protein